jgi:NADH:ubiquinone oxidoreductase subunit 4 (subunit M)
MILAGILLKLGGFGFIKLLFPILVLSSIKFSPLMLTVCIMGTLYTSLSTLKQLDLKKIIAYASIGHMSISIASLFSNSVYGFIGSLLL